MSIINPFIFQQNRLLGRYTTNYRRNCRRCSGCIALVQNIRTVVTTCCCDTTDFKMHRIDTRIDIGFNVQWYIMTYIDPIGSHILLDFDP
jgi:hypothetical protein